jgi:hypothetical protein
VLTVSADACNACLYCFHARVQVRACAYLQVRACEAGMVFRPPLTCFAGTNLLSEVSGADENACAQECIKDDACL